MTRVDDGAPLAEVVRDVAGDFDVTEDTLRRWVRQEKAAASPVETHDTLPASAPTAVAEPVAVAAPAAAAGVAPPKASPSRAKKALAIAAGIAAFFAASAAVRAITASDEHAAAKKVTDYVQGKGTREFVASDLKFRAKFPFGMPKRDSQSETVGATKIEVVSYLTESGNRTFSVSSPELPPGSPFDLNASVNGMAVAVDGRVESATPTTFQSFPAIKFEIKGDGFFSRGLVVQGPNRVYILQAIAETHPSGYDAFEDSFHIDAV